MKRGLFILFFLLLINILFISADSCSTLISCDYSKISGGQYHTCGIRANDSRVLCWGRGSSGQLGDGGTSYNSIPTLITDLSEYVSISAGNLHTCGIRKNDSRVLCWGEGNLGQLGDGSTGDNLIPNFINDTSAYKSLDTISDFTCGIRANDSRVLCWGRGDYGKLGDGNISVHNVPNPILITDFSEYNEISTGAFHTCGIRTSDSRVLCWGRGISGRLGDGITSDHSVGNPTLTQDSSASRDLNLGFSHNCVIRKSDSRILCWGYGFLGQLGNGGTADKSVPTLTTDVSAYTILTTGAQHSCGVRTNDSRVLCWGEGSDGQLGDGSIIVHKILSPNLIIDSSGYSTDETCGFSCISNSCGDGVIIGGEECDDNNIVNGDGCSSTCIIEINPCFGDCGYFKLSSGIYHSCAIRNNDSRVLCWGSGTNGQLGNGDLLRKGDPTLTADTSEYLSVSAGIYHSCGIRANDSRVLCWGNNNYGQLGNGTIGGQKTTPTLTVDTSAYKSVSAGNSYTCGIRANDSRVLCWGSEESGRLGNNRSGFGSVPNPILTMDDSKYLQVSTGYYHTCGIREDGRVLCWGRSLFGQLGDGISIDHRVYIPNLTSDTSQYVFSVDFCNLVCVSCGNGIKESSEQCDDNNLVNGDGCSSICIIEVFNFSSTSCDDLKISTGWSHTCGIRKNDSRVLCWGKGNYGQLGDGSTAVHNNLNPNITKDTSAYLSVSAGGYQTCGIRTSDRRVLCWGYGKYGALGDGDIDGHNVANPTLINDTSAYKSISAGDYYTCGIRKNDSRVLCWGFGGNGELGDGQTLVVQLNPNVTTDTSEYKSISANSPSCGIRKNDSRVLCWGFGGDGQLGDGGTENNLIPTLTTDTSAYKKIATGDYHSCGIRANDSRVLCWGDGGDGELGNGGFTNLNKPTLTSDISAYIQISAGSYYSCGTRLNDTRILCWGLNDDGQLGTGNTNELFIPTLTTDISSYSSNNLSCDLVNTSNNCGNGIKESPEECDDKNLINGDGCSNVCILQPEAYFVDSNGLRITEAYIGETVKLVLNNTGILNGSFNFEIFEDDSVFDDEIRTGSNAISGTFSNVGWGIIIGEWTITEEDYAKTNDYDGFYFKINGYESGKLTVLVQDSTAECKDYENKLSCNSCDNFGCNAAENNVNEKVFKAYPEVWNNTRCGDEILVSGLCNYLMQCKCVWDDILNACSYTWEFIPGLDCGSTPIIGLCSYSENSNDNCEDGFLEYSWTTIWSWGADNGYADFNNGPSNNINNYFLQNGLYYYDPLKLSRNCVGGSNIIPCSAKIRIPFFGFYNFIITIFLIV